MKWCNIHPRYFPITPPFVRYTLSKSVGFKCIYVSYIGELQKSPSTTPNIKAFQIKRIWEYGNISLYLKSIYYYFCEGPIKVIHYYQIELQDALATN